MPRPSEVNPPLPVWNTAVKETLAELSVPFEVTRVAQFRSPRFGATWRLHVTRLDTLASGIVLFGANDVRDDSFGAYRDSLEQTAEPIGPCVLVRTSLPNGRQTWEIVDAAEPETPAVIPGPARKTTAEAVQQ